LNVLGVKLILFISLLNLMFSITSLDGDVEMITEGEGGGSDPAL